MKLGSGISDREIARRWKINIKNFMELKHGHLPPPRIGRLEDLSRLLNVSHSCIWSVCTGNSAERSYKLLPKREAWADPPTSAGPKRKLIRSFSTRKNARLEAKGRSRKFKRSLFRRSRS